MLVAGEISATLAKALVAIASDLHPALDKTFPAGVSKESCVLASLTVRDFLWRVGVKDAEVRPVYVMIRAFDANRKEIHSLGCGDQTKFFDIKGRYETDTPTRWSGHLVVIAGGFLIDTTLYQAARPAWETLPGMMAMPLDYDAGKKVLTGLVSNPDEAGTVVTVHWVEQPHNTRWRRAPDTEKARRVQAVKQLVQAWRQTA